MFVNILFTGVLHYSLKEISCNLYSNATFLRFLFCQQPNFLPGGNYFLEKTVCNILIQILKIQQQKKKLYYLSTSDRNLSLVKKAHIYTKNNKCTFLISPHSYEMILFIIV